MADPVDTNAMGQSKNVVKVQKPVKEKPLAKRSPGPVPNYLGEYGQSPMQHPFPLSQIDQLLKEAEPKTQADQFIRPEKWKVNRHRDRQPPPNVISQ